MTGLNGLKPPFSPNEISREHRITVIEMNAEAQQKSLGQHHERITYLERAVQGLIYATASLAVIKSDNLVDAILKVATK
jgi:hypothetical protein